MLERLGRDNLAELVAFVGDHAIECDLEQTGTIAVADQAYQAAELSEWVERENARGEQLVFLDREAVQAEVHSPIWQAGVLAGPEDTVLLDPVKLSRGLARVAAELGVVIHEGTRVSALERIPRGVRLRTADWTPERDEPFDLGRTLGLAFDPARR